MLREGNIEDVIQILKENRDCDFFNCIAITGKVRRGKSRLAYLIAKGVYPNFSYAENYIGNPKHGEAFKKMFNCPPKSACWVDEAEKILSAERRMDKEQWWLQQLFNQFASHNKTIILCTPSFRRIDSRWRDTHITIWIHIYRRGCGILLKNRDVQSTHDVWGLESMREIELSTRADQFSDERILKNFDANPCALFYFTFSDWETPEQKQEYVAQKEASQKNLLEEFDRWEKLNKQESSNTRAENGIARIAAFLNWKYQIPTSEIGRLAGYSQQSIDRFLKTFGFSIAEGSIQKDDLPKKYFDDAFFEWIKQRYELETRL